MIERLLADWKTGLWLLHCSGKDKFLVMPTEDDWFIVSRCIDENRECIGCHPRGCFPFDPNRAKLEEVKRFKSMDFPQEKLNGYYLTDELITEGIQEFSDKPEQYYWIRCISADLDTVVVFKEVI